MMTVEEKEIRLDGDVHQPNTRSQRVVPNGYFSVAKDSQRIGLKGRK
jgi:hypothetical protein